MSGFFRFPPAPAVLAPMSLALAALLAGCAAVPGDAVEPAPQQAGITPTAQGDWQRRLRDWAGADLLLLGEQHDQPGHQAWEAATVAQLAREDRLAALVLEMAPEGGSTEGLAADASDEQARAALHWEQGAAQGGWPWEAYGPVVMAAVRARVPVLGGNLPRGQIKAAMQERQLDGHLSPAAWKQQLQAIDRGHCGLLPESQWAPMARVQLARDRSLARVAVAASARHARSPAAGATPAARLQVLIVSGNGHARRDLGVPTWLPAGLDYRVALATAKGGPAADLAQGDWWLVTAARATKDHCGQLREQWKAAPGRSDGAS